MPRHDGAPGKESKKESNWRWQVLRLRARPAEYGMNVDRIVALPRKTIKRRLFRCLALQRVVPANVRRDDPLRAFPA